MTSNCLGQHRLTGRAPCPECRANIALGMQTDPARPAQGLYLIATPIGNLGDLSPRAASLIQQLDHLYAEDTRHSMRLLQHLGIERSLQPCHEHNESVVANQVVELVSAGRSCGFLSDAGTPGISDPGFRLVRACRKAGLDVIPVPGPCAAIAALAVSGLPTDRFQFIGFLPPKRAARLRTFEAMQHCPDTLIFYESTHRIEKFLQDAEDTFGPERCICIARELTKLHETVITGPLSEVRERAASRSSKGEFVVLIAKKGYSL